MNIKVFFADFKTLFTPQAPTGLCSDCVWHISIGSDSDLYSAAVFYSFQSLFRKRHPEIIQNSKCYLDSKREPLKFSRLVNTVIFISYMYIVLLIMDAQRERATHPTHTLRQKHESASRSDPQSGGRLRHN